MPYVILICLAAVVCLIPTSLYLRVLAAMSRRPHPVVVTGSWDFAGMVAGLYGWIICGGCVWLMVYDRHWISLLGGDFAAIRAAWTMRGTTWTMLVLLYHLVVGVWIAVVSAYRHRSWTIYNIAPHTATEVVENALHDAGWAVMRRGESWWVNDKAISTCQVYPASGTAVVIWHLRDPVQHKEFERYLRQRAATAPPAGNVPAYPWLMASARGMAIFAVTCLFLMIYAVIPAR